MRKKRVGIITFVFLFVVTSSLLSAEGRSIEKIPGLQDGYRVISAKAQGSLQNSNIQQDFFLRAQEPEDQFEEAIRSDSRRIVGGSARVVYFAKDELFKVYMGLDIWLTEKIFVLAQAVYDPFLAHPLTLSAQGGIRLGNFYPRVGIIESEFGMGMDFYAFKDKFKLSMDVFDFKRNPYPRYMVWAGYAVLKGFQLILGVDVSV